MLSAYSKPDMSYTETLRSRSERCIVYTADLLVPDRYKHAVCFRVQQDAGQEGEGCGPGVVTGFHEISGPQTDTHQSYLNEMLGTDVRCNGKPACQHAVTAENDHAHRAHCCCRD